MISNGLLDPAIVSFVFAPLVITVALLLAIWWKRNAGYADVPDSLLTSAVRGMPEERCDWGAAMMAELGQIHDRMARWRFALGCARVALFPPHSTAFLRTAGRSPLFGMFAVALPPLGLPLLYFAAVIIETIGGSPLTAASRWSNPDAVMVVVKIIMLLMLGCLLAGLPLGLIGWWRRERMRWLSGFGMGLSVGIGGYFLLAMHFLAGGE